MTFKLVTAPGLVLTVIGNSSSFLQNTVQEEWAPSLKSNSISDLFFAVLDALKALADPNGSEMVLQSLVGSILQFNITCFWKHLGSRHYASSSSCVLLTGSKLANFCHFSASLVTYVFFLRALDTAIELTEEHCISCVENINCWCLRLLFFL